jgi:hypothetical protein
MSCDQYSNCQSQPAWILRCSNQAIEPLHTLHRVQAYRRKGFRWDALGLLQFATLGRELTEAELAEARQKLSDYGKATPDQNSYKGFVDPLLRVGHHLRGPSMDAFAMASDGMNAGWLRQAWTQIDQLARQTSPFRGRSRAWRGGG